jgi:hypothetical protein
MVGFVLFLKRGTLFRARVCFYTSWVDFSSTRIYLSFVSHGQVAPFLTGAGGAFSSRMG